MAAIHILPHPLTGENSNSDEFTSLVEQLDEAKKTALLMLIYAMLPPGARMPCDGQAVAYFARKATRLDRPAFIEALAEFALLLVARKSLERTGQ